MIPWFSESCVSFSRLNNQTNVVVTKNTIELKNKNPRRRILHTCISIFYSMSSQNIEDYQKVPKRDYSLDRVSQHQYLLRFMSDNQANDQKTKFFYIIFSDQEKASKTLSQSFTKKSELGLGPPTRTHLGTRCFSLLLAGGRVETQHVCS